MNQRKRTGIFRAFITALLTICTLLTSVVLVQTVAEAQSATVEGADFSCTLTEEGGDALLAFSGDDLGRSANVRSATTWIATVTGDTQYRVEGGARQLYQVVLNGFDGAAYCTPPAAPAGPSFACTRFIEPGTNTLSLGLSGDDLGTTANLRNDAGWVATLTNRTSFEVSPDGEYWVVLNDFDTTVPCLEQAVEQPNPVRPISDYSCQVTTRGGNATVTVGGERGTNENLRRDGNWAGQISATSTEVTINGGAGSTYEVRLRGNGYNEESIFVTAPCVEVEVECETSAILVLCDDGVLLGSTGDYRTDTGQPIPKATSFLQSEALIGRQYDIFHDFLGAGDWGRIANGGFPYSDNVGQLLDDGRVLFLNWKNPGGVTAWSSIAAGSQNAVIDATAAELAAYGEPMFLTFHHEPEDNIAKSGESRAGQERLVDDYAAAWRHIHDRFEAAGADNVIFVWDMQGNLRQFQWMYEAGLYPGDEYVDWVGWNPYNFYGCRANDRTWKTAPDTFGDFYEWLEEGGQNRPSLDKPLMIGEFSTTENDGRGGSSQTKGDWFASLPDLFANDFPRIKALVMFDTEGTREDGSIQFCEWSIHSSPGALQGWTEAANHPMFNSFGG